MEHPNPLCPVHGTDETLIGCPCNDRVPEGFTEVAFLPKPKYVVIEEDDGWHAYSHDDHGAFS